MLEQLARLCTCQAGMAESLTKVRQKLRLEGAPEIPRPDKSRCANERSQSFENAGQCRTQSLGDHPDLAVLLRREPFRLHSVPYRGPERWGEKIRGLPLLEPGSQRATAASGGLLGEPSWPNLVRSAPGLQITKVQEERRPVALWGPIFPQKAVICYSPAERGAPWRTRHRREN